MSTAKRLITAEDLYRIELPSDVRLSPDGSQIAFLSNRADKEKPAQVYLIPFGGGEARKLTDIQGEIGELSWSPDGKKLLCTVRNEGNLIPAFALRINLASKLRHFAREPTRPNNKQFTRHLQNTP